MMDDDKIAGILKEGEGDGDDIYIMVKCLSVCLSVTKNDHFLLGVSCNHLNPPPPSGMSAKAMLTGEEYFPASFFCLRASSSWNDDIFDTDSFLRHKMIHLLRSLSLLPHWNLLIFLTCKSKYKNQRT